MNEEKAESLRVDSIVRGLCQWFLMCDNEAEYNVAHPILGQVPTCGRCVQKALENGMPVDNVADLR